MRNLFNIRISNDDMEIANTRLDEKGLDDLIKAVRRKYG